MFLCMYVCVWQTLRNRKHHCRFAFASFALFLVQRKIKPFDYVHNFLWLCRRIAASHSAIWNGARDAHSASSHHFCCARVKIGVSFFFSCLFCRRRFDSFVSFCCRWFFFGSFGSRSVSATALRTDSFSYSVMDCVFLLFGSARALRTSARMSEFISTFVHSGKAAEKREKKRKIETQQINFNTNTRRRGES